MGSGIAEQGAPEFPPFRLPERGDFGSLPVRPGATAASVGGAFSW